MAGTFRLDYIFFSSSGTYGTEPVGYLGLADYYVGANVGGGASGFTNARIDYIPFGNCLSLDGGAFGDLSTLPLGFCFAAGTTGLLKPPATSNYPGYAQQRTATGVLGDFARVKVDLNGSSVTTQVTGTGAVNGPIFTGASAGSVPLAYVIDLFVGPQLYLTVSTDLFTASAFQLLRLSGSYITISWSWQIDNGINFSSPVVGKYFTPEAKFEVSSGGGTGGNLANIYSANNPTGTGPDLLGGLGPDSGDGVYSVVFSWNDAAGNQSIEVVNTDFEDWTWYYFWFNLPASLPTGKLITVSVKSTGFPPIPAPEGTGTQFSGSVKLGNIKILGTEASGIYKLVSGKTNDTLYINSPVDNTTADFAIPNPFGKTGFIGG